MTNFHNMKVVMLSKTPLAGAVYETVKCLRKYAGLDIRWIAIKNRYNDGRVFPKDLLWSENSDLCLKLIREADIIHMHNEIFPYAREIWEHKNLVVQFHSVPKRADFDEMCKLTIHCYTLKQPLQEFEYNLPGLPNLMDPEEYFPIDKPIGNKLKIVFAPTNDWPSSSKGSKGKYEVIKILDEFSAIADVEIFSNLPYEVNLKLKRESDILIDDVVNRTFHKTTIEGCCFGLVVLTSTISRGWLYADLNTLRDLISDLIDDYEKVKIWKMFSREWIKTEWHPKNLVNLYMEVYRKCYG